MLPPAGPPIALVATVLELLQLASLRLYSKDGLGDSSLSHLIGLRQGLENTPMSFASMEAALMRPTLVFSQELPIDLGARWFAPSLAWLVPRGDNSTALDGLPLRLDSNFLTYSANAGGSVDVHEWYKIKDSKVARKALVGRFYTGTEVFEAAAPLDKWERRANLQGVTMVNAIRPWGSFNFDLGGGKYGGLMADILGHLRAHLNFTVRHVGAEDGEWGRLVEGNDSRRFTGMVGVVHRGEADLCTAGLTMTADRMEGIEFTFGILLDLTTLHIIDPAAIRGGAEAVVNFDAYVAVFSNPAWAACGAALLALGAANGRAFWARKNLPSTLGRLALQFLEGLNFTFCSFLQIGPSETLVAQGLSSKTLAMVTYALCFVLFSSYTGDLTARMTAGKAPLAFRSFRDVLGAEYAVGAQVGTSQTELLASAREGTSLSALHANLVEHGGPASSLAELVHLLDAEPRFAVFASRFLSMSLNASLPVKTLTALEDVVPTHLAWGLQPDSEFKDMFNYHLLKIRQSGLLRSILHKWLEEDRPPDESGRIFVDDANALGFNNLFFPAGMLMAGVTLACSLVLGECLTKAKVPPRKASLRDIARKKARKTNQSQAPKYRA